LPGDVIGFVDFGLCDERESNVQYCNRHTYSN
jgi:hypothetical protein